MLSRGTTAQSVSIFPPSRSMDGRTELQLLRHLTKNALQRILGQVLETPGIEASPAGRALAGEIERRIKLSAAISDALFGLTQSPGTLSARLRSLCQSVIDLYADPAQMIGLEVTVECSLPGALEPNLLGIVQELVGNAVKHGMHMRLMGRITLHLESDPHGSALLTVANDGWPIGDERAAGEGLELVAELAAAVGGRMEIGAGAPTTIEVRLPLASRKTPARTGDSAVPGITDG